MRTLELEEALTQHETAQPANSVLGQVVTLEREAGRIEKIWTDAMGEETVGMGLYERVSEEVLAPFYDAPGDYHRTSQAVVDMAETLAVARIVYENGDSELAKDALLVASTYALGPQLRYCKKKGNRIGLDEDSGEDMIALGLLKSTEGPGVIWHGDPALIGGMAYSVANNTLAFERNISEVAEAVTIGMFEEGGPPICEEDFRHKGQPELLDFYMKNWQENDLPLTPEELSLIPHDQVSRSDKVRNAISTLSPDLQTVVISTFWDEKSVEEIAGLIRKSGGTIRNYKEKAIRFLGNDNSLREMCSLPLRVEE